MYIVHVTIREGKVCIQDLVAHRAGEVLVSVGHCRFPPPPPPSPTPQYFLKKLFVCQYSTYLTFIHLQVEIGIKEVKCLAPRTQHSDPKVSRLTIRPPHQPPSLYLSVFCKIDVWVESRLL